MHEQRARLLFSSCAAPATLFLHIVCTIKNNREHFHLFHIKAEEEEPIICSFDHDLFKSLSYEACESLVDAAEPSHHPFHLTAEIEEKYDGDRRLSPSIGTNA